jgi:hypothetical protein
MNPQVFQARERFCFTLSVAILSAFLVNRFVWHVQTFHLVNAWAVVLFRHRTVTLLDIAFILFNSATFEAHIFHTVHIIWWFIRATILLVTFFIALHTLFSSLHFNSHVLHACDKVLFIHPAIILLKLSTSVFDLLLSVLICMQLSNQHL